MLDAAVVHYEMMLTIGHERGDEDAIAMSLHHLGSIALDRDHLASARTLLEDSLTRRRRLGRIHGIAGVLATLGTLSAVEGKFPAARSLFEESLALARRDGHDRDTAHTLRSYGHAALEHGDSRAEALFE